MKVLNSVIEAHVVGLFKAALRNADQRRSLLVEPADLQHVCASGARGSRCQRYANARF